MTFMVSPLKLEFQGIPGQSSTQVVKVANQGAAPLRVTSGVMDYYITPNNSFVYYPPGHQSYSCARWLKTNISEFRLIPNQVQEVTVTVSAPTGAEIGGHYACLFFQTASSRPKGSGVGVIGRIGTVILASVGNEKDLVRDGRIKSFEVTNPWFGRDTSGRVVFHNAGNVHLTLRGQTVIKDFFGREVARLPLQDITVLPGTDRYLPFQWTGPLFGRFTAQANVQYGPDLFTYNVTRTSPTVVFWIVPWLLILAMLIALLAVWRIWLGRRARRRAAAVSHQPAIPT